MDFGGVVGIDIGGANLKFARRFGASCNVSTRSTFFPMWTDFDRLGSVLLDELSTFGNFKSIAITMTGELADCFIDRGEGVRHIAGAARWAARQHWTGSGTVPGQIAFYGVDGIFRNHDQAVAAVDLVAAANWHATASMVSRSLCSNAGILVDIGSTTTDLIPFQSEQVTTNAQTDHERLLEGSLVYIGCRRTSVGHVLSHLSIDGQQCPVMNELFATMDDVLLVLGIADEDETDTQTADGRPRTVLMAANRIARMVGLDHRSIDLPTARDMASQILAKAKQQVMNSFSKVDHGGTIVIGGHGEALFDIPSNREVINLADQFGPDASRCFPAYAVAFLLERERAQP